MKKSILLILVFLSFVVSYAGDKGKWTGWISDSNCGAKGNKEGHAACAAKCIKGGAAPVFVVGEKVYAITDPKKITDEFVGQKVTITGTITGDKLEIETITK